MMKVGDPVRVKFSTKMYPDSNQYAPSSAYAGKVGVVTEIRDNDTIFDASVAFDGGPPTAFTWDELERVDDT